MRRAARAENVDETARRDEGGGTNTLTRAITGPLLFVFILGDVLGAGIYALVGVIAGEVGGAVWVPLLVALVMALLTATSYAELVTKYPRAGGAAVFAQRAYRKPLISFLVGFSMLAAGVTSAAGLALAFSGDYLKAFIDVPTVPAALVFLLLVGLLNARGIKESMRANVVMTVVEVTGLVLVVVLACIVLGRGDGTLSRVVEFDDQPIACTRGAGCGTPRVLLFCRLRNVRERRRRSEEREQGLPTRTVRSIADSRRRLCPCRPGCLGGPARRRTCRILRATARSCVSRRRRRSASPVQPDRVGRSRQRRTADNDHGRAG